MTTTAKLGVAILGGGMAGNLLARQIRRTLPDVQVGIFEKSTEDPHKLGESMVELATNHFIRKLGLSSYLYDRHYPKNGLRFFFDTPERNAPLHEMSEIGSVSLPFHPAFQIDRKRIDGDLSRMNAADGVQVRRGVRVRDIELGREGAPHRFTAVEDGRSTRVEARWLIDASGRSRLLARLERLAEPETELVNASVWGRYEGVTDVDTLGPESFRSRIRYSARRLSTIHFLYPGYWIWFIPLRDGITSVGLVCEREILRPEMRSQEGFMEFVRSHAAAASLLENAKPVDHGCYMQLAYRTKRFFHPDRWGMTGEAACFTDPFYSPGSDFIALENDFLTDLIQRDRAGTPREELALRTRLYDEFMLFRQDATFLLYRGQYSLLGSYEVCKLKWDLDIGSYYNLWVDAYMRDQHLDAAWLESQLAQRPYVLRALENFRQAFAKVESRLRETGDYYRRNLGEYNDGRDCLGFLAEVGRTRDVALTLARTGEIFNRVRGDAQRILGMPGEPKAMPLPRFMGRRPLL
jgi:flavin-dependent dehydrogenase